MDPRGDKGLEHTVSGVRKVRKVEVVLEAEQCGACTPHGPNPVTPGNLMYCHIIVAQHEPLLEPLDVPRRGNGTARALGRWLPG